jgi:hypothetical protein
VRVHDCDFGSSRSAVIVDSKSLNMKIVVVLHGPNSTFLISLLTVALDSHQRQS